MTSTGLSRDVSQECNLREEQGEEGISARRRDRAESREEQRRKRAARGEEEQAARSREESSKQQRVEQCLHLRKRRSRAQIGTKGHEFEALAAHSSVAARSQ